MPRLPLFAASVLVLATLSAAPVQAAESRGVSMEILVDGRPVTEHRSGARSYIEAKKGRNYTIVLRNDTAGRVAVALAVDGLNTIDAKHTAAIDAKKWVLGPYETAEIKGWQVDGSHARKFVFTSEEKSYGAWLGQTSNLGIISAVFYAEKPGPVCCYPTPTDPYSRYDLDDDTGGVAELEERARDTSRRSEAREKKAPARAGSRKPGTAPEPSADAGGDVTTSSTGSSRRGSGGKVAATKASKKKEERAATGMGTRTRHHVEWVAFDLDPDPITTFDVRYAYRDELLALGIDVDGPTITRAIERRERAQGFAPDPGQACCR